MNTCSIWCRRGYGALQGIDQREDASSDPRAVGVRKRQDLCHHVESLKDKGLLVQGLESAGGVFDGVTYASVVLGFDIDFHDSGHEQGISSRDEESSEPGARRHER